MYETVSVDSPSPRELPADLRQWLPAGRLLALANEAAGVVAKDALFRHPQFETFSAPLLLGLLSYCYATNSFGSNDIEWEVLNDVLLNRFCGSSLPDAPAIRRFRRAYRPWILQCLICLLEKAIAEPAEQSRAVPADNCAALVDWASRRIQLAILMDVSAAD
jgi:hypothetical protein